MAFIALAVAAAVRRRSAGSGSAGSKFEVSMETSAQLPIRIAVVLIFALAYLASELGLDLLLGGFVAGVIVRLALKGREVTILESKLSAVGYGFLIPFFFVVSGIEFDVSASSTTPQRADSRADLLPALPRRPRGAGDACSTARSSTSGIARRLRSSAPPSCRWWSRSRRSRSREGEMRTTTVGCARRRRCSSRRRSIRCSVCGCAARRPIPRGSDQDEVGVDLEMTAAGESPFDVSFGARAASSSSSCSRSAASPPIAGMPS